MSINKNRHFLPPPPNLVHVVIEWLLIIFTSKKKVYMQICLSFRYDKYFFAPVPLDWLKPPQPPQTIDI